MEQTQGGGRFEQCQYAVGRVLLHDGLSVRVERFSSDTTNLHHRKKKNQGRHLVRRHLCMVRIPNRKLRPGTYFIDFFFSLNVSRFTVVHLRLSSLRRRAGPWRCRLPPH